MAEEQATNSGAGASSAGTQNTGDEQPKTVPYDRFQDVNEKRKAAETELQKLRDAESARKLKEQEDAGKFQDVINTLKPKAERSEALEKALTEYLQAEIADVPEDMRDLIPQGDATMQINWIKQAKARGLFTRPNAPSGDGGQRGDGKPQPKLTADELAMAKRMNITPEKYLASKLKDQPT